MKKRVLPILLSLCLMASMLPTALAADTDTPSVVGMTIMGETAQVDGPALKTTIPSEKSVTLDGTALVASEAVDFQVQDGYGSAQDVIYVSAAADGSATLRIRIAAGSSGDIQTASINLASNDGVTWTGSGGGFAGVTVGALANELGNRAITIPAGGMVSQADGSASAEAVLRANHDAGNVYLMLYPAGLEEYTVTYDYGDGTYTFVLPENSILTDITLPNQTGQEFVGWYTDEACTQAAVLNVAVTSDMTLYAKFDDTTGDTSFTEALERGDSVLPISDITDFTAFVARADEVTADQRVELQNDLPLGGASFSSIIGFKGEFDGQNFTISNATFTAVGDNSGMFATLNPGQIIANLKLDTITVNNATNSGTLAGSINGGEGNRPLIQNIQVTNSDVTGRNAGGIAGYAFLTDLYYCSVNTSAVQGVVNAGGIAGIAYSRIEDCYATITPTTTLPVFNDIGGIVAKNLESGHIEHCWTTFGNISSRHDEGLTTEIHNLSGVDYSTTESAFTAEGFSSDIWVFDGDWTDFNPDAIEYSFEEA